MTYTLEEKYEKIHEDIKKCTSKSPIKIAMEIMMHDYVNMHGPEHHFLDGSALIVAFKNCGGVLDLDTALDSLKKRTIKMPAGMCGGWGVCGAVTGVGAALAVINSQSQLTAGDMYGENMEHTSRAVKQMSTIGGPRCCKRNAYITLSNAVSFVREKYKIDMESGEIECGYSIINSQCIRERCSYYTKAL